MLGLGQTTARLARYRRQWKKFLAAESMPEGAPRTTVLPEQTGFGSNPGNLRMFTYVPPHLRPQAPLVVVLHGCAQTAGAYDFGAGWSVLADRYGFALLLPEQKRTNNPNTCFTWFTAENTTRDRGEALSIRQMIAHMDAMHDIDRSRVYVTGLSAGGAMAAVMLATYPELFAGGAIIGGLPYGAAGNVQEAFDAMFQGLVRPAAAWGEHVRAASPHAGPWPKLSVWHGDADQTVKPVNADEIVKQWTDVHGLNAAPSLETTVNGHRRRVWHNGSGESVLESYTIAGMAHGVPIDADACGQPAPFFLDAGIASTERIAAFWGLTAHPAAVAHANGRPHAHGEAGIALHQDRHRDGSRWRRHVDPDAIIARALRAAGLMK